MTDIVARLLTGMVAWGCFPSLWRLVRQLSNSMTCLEVQSNTAFTNFTSHRKDILSVTENIEKADTILLDPPRPGLGMKAVRAICTLSAHVIIYISCNPTTLARDLKLFAEEGYTIERVVPVDMFPHTYHIETVVKLRK